MQELEIVRRRLHVQGVVGDGFAAPAEVVRHLGAVQAQDHLGAKWALGQRVRGCTDAGVEAAFARGELVRTHVLRPTWHFVAPDDVRWMLELTAPRVRALNAYWYRRLGLDDALLARSRAILTAALASGEPRVRAELAGALRAACIEADALRLSYICMDAELAQAVCSGPRRGGRQTYVLLDQRVPATPRRSREEALAELTLRFFTSHGPATVRDFTWWSSLTAVDARAGLRLVGDRLVRATVGALEYWHAPQPGEPERAVGTACLLGEYDECGVAYRDLSLVWREPRDAGLDLQRPLLVGGETVGSWKRTFEDKGVRLEVTPFTPLNDDDRRAIGAAAQRYERFIERPVTLALG